MLTRNLHQYIHVHTPLHLSIQTVWQMKTKWSFQPSPCSSIAGGQIAGGPQKYFQNLNGYQQLSSLKLCFQFWNYTHLSCLYKSAWYNLRGHLKWTVYSLAVGKVWLRQFCVKYYRFLPSAMSCNLQVNKSHITARLKEVRHLKSKLSMFCILSQNYEHFFLKNDPHKLSEKLKNGIKISIGQVVLESQMQKICFDQNLENPLAYKISNAVFEILRQFGSRCLYCFSKKVLITLR